MIREKISYFIGLFIMLNLFLFYVILEPKIEQIRAQVENGGVVEATAFSPIYHDFYFDYILVDTRIEGDWQVEFYKEVKTLIDENGQKVAELDTGNIEYVRYWVGK